MGMVLFVLAASRAHVVRGDGAGRSMPWLIPLLVTLAIITYVPQTVLWLPTIFYK